MKVILFNVWDDYPDDNTGMKQNTELICLNSEKRYFNICKGDRKAVIEKIKILHKFEALVYMKGIIDCFFKQINSKAHTTLEGNKLMLFDLPHTERLKMVDFFKNSFTFKDANIVVFSKS